MATIQRIFGILWPLLLAIVIVLPVLPPSWTGELGAALGRTMRVISVGHRWVMYDHPSRQQARLRVEAEFEDGTRADVPLPPRRGAWDRDRRLLWEEMVAHADRHNRNLRWFLRGHCRRATQLGLGSPQRVVLTRRVRRLRSPTAVRQGKGVWGPWRETVVTSQPCPRAAASP